MTKEEVAELILRNATLYKQMMKPLTDEELEDTIDEWTSTTTVWKKSGTGQRTALTCM